MDIVEAKLGTVGEAQLDLVGGKLLVSVDAKEPGGLVEGKLTVGCDLVAVLKLVAQKIPGTIDDAIIGVVVAAVEAAK